MASDKSAPAATADKPAAATSVEKPTLSTRAHDLKQTARTALERASSSQHAQAGARFFSACTYAASAPRLIRADAKTWVGMSPLWLMGEAILPGQKVGSQFSKGASELAVAAQELRQTLALAASDVLVVIDSQLKSGKEESAKTAELLKAAGGNAVVVVSTSLDKAGDRASLLAVATLTA